MYPQLKKCVDCEQSKPTMSFPGYKEKSSGKIYRRTRCRECYNAYLRTLERRPAKAGLYGPTIVCVKCGEEKAKEAYYWNTSSGYINKKCKPCFDAANNYKERSRRLRTECLKAYGNCCACCGEAEPIFLTFDHVNDDGAEHRTKVSAGYSMYIWLKKNEYPDTIQVLCYNCNNAKKLGGCPHKVEL